MSRKQKFSTVLFLGLTIFTGSLPFALPQTCLQALQDGLALCGGSLLLSLFPFLIVSSLLIQCPVGDLLGLPFYPIVRILGMKNPCAARVLMIGFWGGFAPAASAVSEAVRTHQLTSDEADALLPACVCSGPSFVILTVGQYLLNSVELGVCLFAAQILAGYLSAALLYRLHLHADHDTPSPQVECLPVPPVRLDSILTSASQTYLKICGFILYFRMLAAGVEKLFPSSIGVFGAMLLEVCSGCALASQTGFWASSLCCMSLSLQGLSVLLQIRTICPPEMTLHPLCYARMFHLPLSLAIFYLLIPDGAQSVFNTLCPRVIAINHRLPLDCALLVFAACCITAAELSKTLQRQKLENPENRLQDQKEFSDFA